MVQVRAKFSADTEVKMEDFVEGEPYQDAEGTLYIFLITVDGGLYLLNLESFRLHPFESFLHGSMWIHKGTVESLELKR